MTFENQGRYHTIEGKRYEWRWVGSLCGMYEIEEPEEQAEDDAQTELAYAQVEIYA